MSDTDISKSVEFTKGWVMYQGWELRYFPDNGYTNGFRYTFSIDVSEPDNWDATEWPDGGQRMVDRANIDFDGAFTNKWNPTEAEISLLEIEEGMPYPDVGLLKYADPDIPRWNVSNFHQHNSFELGEGVQMRYCTEHFEGEK